jgi:hypothetical protein
MTMKFTSSGYGGEWMTRNPPLTEPSSFCGQRGPSRMARKQLGKAERRVAKTVLRPVWHVLREYARRAGVERLAPQEQIQFLLAQVSIQTTERYLGWKQRIRSGVNDRVGIEPQN